MHDLAMLMRNAEGPGDRSASASILPATSRLLPALTEISLVGRMLVAQYAVGSRGPRTRYQRSLSKPPDRLFRACGWRGARFFAREGSGASGIRERR